MGWSSKLGMSRILKTGQRGRAVWLVATGAIVGTALLAGHSGPALASLPCGTRPVIPSEDDARQIKLDAQTKVDVIRQAPASANLRAMVTASRHELWAKYPDVEKPTLDHYLLWVTCRTISNDPSLAATQMFDEYANLYRLMSEPIATGAAPEK